MIMRSTASGNLLTMRLCAALVGHSELAGGLHEQPHALGRNLARGAHWSLASVRVRLR